MAVTMPGLFFFNGLIGTVVTTVFTQRPKEVVDVMTTKDEVSKYGGYLNTKVNLIPYTRFGLLAGSYTLSCFFIANEPDSTYKSLYALSWIFNYASHAIHIWRTTKETEWPMAVFNMFMASLFTYYLTRVGFSINDLKNVKILPR